MLNKLLLDEGGFVVSAELVLVCTMLVVGLIVGLSEVQHAIVGELNDVGEAIGSLNQSFSFSGFSKHDKGGCHAFSRGSMFMDRKDDCDCNECAIGCDKPVNEGPKGGGMGGWW